MIRRALIGFAIWLAAVLSAHAEVPTDVRSACSGDAFRFCPMSTLLAAGIGKLSGVEQCFRAHRRSLSHDCVVALERWRTGR